MHRSNLLLMKVVASFALFVGLAIPAQLAASSASAATPVQLSLKVLLIGNPVTSPADPTTSAWAAAMTAEGVPYTEVDAAGAAVRRQFRYRHFRLNSRQLQRHHLRRFTGELCRRSTDHTVQRTRRPSACDRSMVYTAPYYGLTLVAGGALDGTDGQLTPSGLTALPELAGSIPFSSGSYGYTATVVAGAPFTPWLENTAGAVLAGVYQHRHGPAGERRRIGN